MSHQTTSDHNNSTFMSMAIFWKCLYPIPSEWELRTTGWDLKTLCCREILISVLLHNCLFHCTLLITQCIHSVKVKCYLPVWIFDKDTDSWMAYSYDASHHTHSTWKTTLFFSWNIWWKKISIWWIKEHVHTGQLKHLSELILPQDQISVYVQRDWKGVWR